MKKHWRQITKVCLIVALLAAGIHLFQQNASVAQTPYSVSSTLWPRQPAKQPGFPATTSGAHLEYGSSPTLSDLDGDGKLEVILAGRDLVNGNPGCGGMVYAYHHNGTLYWQTHVRAPINSSPTTADITGDGHPDIVVSMGGYANEPQCWHGGVAALDGLTGRVLWVFDTQDWLNHVHDGWRDGVYSTPAVSDINGDGFPEIVFGAWDQCLYLLDRNGQPLWGNLPGILGEVYCGGHGFYNEDVFWSSPALADVTGDGRPEIITGADISPGNIWGDPAGGYLYILNADGNTLAREWMDQVIYSSPAVADLDQDGQPEFVVGTGTYWVNKGYYVSAFDYDPAASDVRDRLVLKWRKPTAGRVFASPAVGDLNKDGWLDVVITVPIGEWGADGSLIYAWRGRDGASLFQRRACDVLGSSGNTASSPTIADIDGDSWPEVLFSHMWEVSILDHDGTYYTDYSNPLLAGSPRDPRCTRDHAPSTDLSYDGGYSLYSSPAIGDLDQDGDAEIVIGGHNPSNPKQGMVFAWTGHSLQAKPAWPTWRHDPQHTGNYQFETIPPTNPTSFSSPSHTPETWTSSNQVQMTWSGAKDMESGLAGYSIVWDTSPTTLPDTTIDLGATANSATSPPLPDGSNHYFHLRTSDRAGNWTADALHFGPLWIDATPPTSWASSPALVTGPFEVTWGGTDAGSGISHYTIQVRDGNGLWITWQESQSNTSAVYQGTAGHAYSFRSIAHDRSGQVETQYTSEGDTRTLVAAHLLSGTIHDLRGNPVAGASVTSQPAALNQAVTGTDGRFTLGMPATDAYELTASHLRFGPLPPMLDVIVDRDRDGVAFYLPPEPNLVEDGDFETLGAWDSNGVVLPAPVEGQGHTGQYALQLGSLPAASQSSPANHSPDRSEETTTQGTAASPASSPAQAPSTWTWAISQTTSLPADIVEPTLAWLYRAEGDAAPDDTLLVTVKGPTSTIVRTLNPESGDWVLDWIDLSDFARQQVDVHFALVRKSTERPLTVWLDEIRLGPPPKHLIYIPLAIAPR